MKDRTEPERPPAVSVHQRGPRRQASQPGVRPAAIPVVIAMVTGERIKGVVQDFPAGWTILKVKELDRTGVVDDVCELFFKDVVAVFFVRELVDDRHHREHEPAPKGRPPEGMVRLQLAWGETLDGRIERGADPRGIFFLPAPSSSRGGNILRVWLKKTAIVRSL